MRRHCAATSIAAFLCVPCICNVCERISFSETMKIEKDHIYSLQWWLIDKVTDYLYLQTQGLHPLFALEDVQQLHWPFDCKP